MEEQNPPSFGLIVVTSKLGFRLNEFCHMGYQVVSPSSIPCRVLFLIENFDVHGFLGIQPGVHHAVLVFCMVDIVGGEVRAPCLHLCITNLLDSDF